RSFREEKCHRDLAHEVSRGRSVHFRHDFPRKKRQLSRVHTEEAGPISSHISVDVCCDRWVLGSAGEQELLSSLLFLSYIKIMKTVSCS
ncbi:unnamed protein product, partial [Hapterophycus canaliculatus]